MDDAGGIVDRTSEASWEIGNGGHPPSYERIPENDGEGRGARHPEIGVHRHIDHGALEERAAPRLDARHPAHTRRPEAARRAGLHNALRPGARGSGDTGELGIADFDS